MKSRKESTKKNVEPIEGGKTKWGRKTTSRIFIQVSQEPTSFFSSA
jgi:hypothetical protein